MAPRGKNFPKIPVFELAKTSGCAYAARVTVASPRRLGRVVRKAILAARETGPSYVQIYTPCPTNLRFPPDKTLSVAKAAQVSNYAFEEFMTADARRMFETATEDAS
jgi:pyruvate ferredoxin oxidoreductase beta subunit